ncbi:ABC transporter permease [Ideonella sp. 4Y11]|uniref:Transport permease protein n=1 Tax=Ideonella aquatica TaxID=2824119 RepID=A0A940YVD5_9BURK|nr:ABC transporter permease [Ideonella aquatica]MBQ0959950.1 ABC transporter permease [Ideonella aquatica]
MSLSAVDQVLKRRSPWQIQRAVVFALMMRELKTRFGGHWTGVFWMFAEPIAELLMFLWMNTAIRGRISRDGYDFIVFLLAGATGFRMFRALWNRLSHAASANRGLFGFKQVKPMDAFVARTALYVVLEIAIFLMTALLLARMGYGPMVPHDILAFMGVLSQFVLFGLALGIIFAVLLDVAPRLDAVTSVLTMPIMILSGVIFRLDQLPPEVIQLLLYNPLLHLVEMSRVAYLPSYRPLQGANILYPSMWTICAVTLALMLYRWRHRQLIAS